VQVSADLKALEEVLQSEVLAKLKKKAFQIDDEYELIFHQFGASLRKSIGDEVIYKNVKKGIKIDISKLKNKEYTFDDLVEIKNECLGKYEGEDMQLKSGKYGPYVQWGDKRQSIKNIKKDLNEVSLSDIISYIDEINNPLPDSEDKPRAPPQIASKNILPYGTNAIQSGSETKLF
jgi:topoisomerase IA-like protein